MSPPARGTGGTPGPGTARRPVGGATMPAALEKFENAPRIKGGFQDVDPHSRPPSSSAGW
eukprot:11915236-Alexandrium_andersonii.AAC.1